MKRKVKKNTDWLNHESFWSGKSSSTPFFAYGSGERTSFFQQNNSIQRAPGQISGAAGGEYMIVGNTMDFVRGEKPVESGLGAATGLPTKSPNDKKKMGGSLGPVKEGSGKSTDGLSDECAKWTRIKRTTYGYDPKATDSVEKDFLEKYQKFKEGIPIAEPADFNKKLKTATANPCTCIEKLSVDGHGASWSGGGQEFAPRKHSLADRSFGVKMDADGKIVPYNFHLFDGITFCKPCSIVLGGCYVGLNKPKTEAGASGFKGAGDALGKALAKKTGCSVTAYTDLTTTPKPGEFKGGTGGKWITTLPPGKK